MKYEKLFAIIIYPAFATLPFTRRGDLKLTFQRDDQKGSGQRSRPRVGMAGSSFSGSKKSKLSPHGPQLLSPNSPHPVDSKGTQ